MAFIKYTGVGSTLTRIGPPVILEVIMRTMIVTTQIK